MQATEYGSTNKIYFNENNVLFVVKDGFECVAHFVSGISLSLSLSGMQEFLSQMPRVFSYEFYLPVFLNTKEIESYSTDGVVVNVAFNNGRRLKELSRKHFNENVVPLLDNNQVCER